MRKSVNTKNPYYFLNIKEVMGTVAMWAIRQSPYHCPENLEIVMECISNSIEPEKFIFDTFFEIHPDYLYNWINKTLKSIPEVISWNHSKKKRTLADLESKDPDFDFIDLDALVRNVYLTLKREEEKRISEFEAEKYLVSEPKSV